MATCFVIQPFDGGKYDRRYEETFKPAIEAAGLEPYRVDADLGASVPIEAIEKGIESSLICFADITEDNPNVWFEIGYALALGKPLVIVCSDERTGKKYPFDIQHRLILNYRAESAGDFKALESKITERIKAILESGEQIRQISANERVAPSGGLSQSELIVLAVIVGILDVPDSPVSINYVKRSAQQTILNDFAVTLGLKKLSTRGFIHFDQLYDQEIGERYDAVGVTASGWSWIEANEEHFQLRKPEKDPLAF